MIYGSSKIEEKEINRNKNLKEKKRLKICRQKYFRHFKKVFFYLFFLFL